MIIRKSKVNMEIAMNNNKQNGNSKKNSNSSNSHNEDSKKGFDKFEDKLKGTVKNIKDSEFYSYASSNKEQTISYILLALGIILLFINTFVGGLIVGMVAGYHFSKQVVYYLRNLNKIFEGHDQLRYIVLSGVLFALLIAAPGVFVGAAIVAIFKELFLKNSGVDSRDDSDVIDPSQRNYKE